MPLTPLTKGDLEMILPWRNAPAVRRAMYTHHEISLEEHRAWFARMEADPTKRWLIYRDAAGEPQGVVYFVDIDDTQQTASWGFYAGPKTCRGTGLRILLEALDYAFSELELVKLSAEVLADNAASDRLHRKVGFIEEGRLRGQHFDGESRIDVVRLGMFAEEWAEHRPTLVERIAELDRLAAAPPHHTHTIVIATDLDSWMNAAIDDLAMEWEAQGHTVTVGYQVDDLPSGDFCFCLGLGQLMPDAVRARFKHVLVVHESDLPHGRGWSPLTWQILEGKNQIPVTLFEAEADVDSGPVYAQQWLAFEGHELIDELRAAQASATHALCRWFVDEHPESAEQVQTQKSASTYYASRSTQGRELDSDNIMSDHLDHLGLVDNERYPAFFNMHGQRYVLLISKVKNQL